MSRWDYYPQPRDASSRDVETSPDVQPAPQGVPFAHSVSLFAHVGSSGSDIRAYKNFIM